MLAFRLGLVIAFSAGTAGIVIYQSTVNAGWPPILPLLAVVWAVPLLAACTAAELVRGMRGPRLRALNPAHSSPLGRLSLGLFAGLLSLAASLAALVYWRPPPADVVTMALGGALGPALAIGFCRRIRPGLCLRCGYDLRGLTPASHGKCPECGADVNPNMLLPVTAAES